MRQLHVGKYRICDDVFVIDSSIYFFKTVDILHAQFPVFAFMSILHVSLL